MSTLLSRPWAPRPSVCAAGAARPPMAVKQSPIYWPAVAAACVVAVLAVVGLLLVLANSPRPERAPIALPSAAAAPIEADAGAPAALQAPPEPTPVGAALAPLSPDRTPPRLVEVGPRIPEPALPPALICPVRRAPQNYGTRVAFLSSPAVAARQAQEEGKLLFVLHVSGNFEDSTFT